MRGDDILLAFEVWPSPFSYEPFQLKAESVPEPFYAPEEEYLLSGLYARVPNELRCCANEPIWSTQRGAKCFVKTRVMWGKLILPKIMETMVYFWCLLSFPLYLHTTILQIILHVCAFFQLFKIFCFLKNLLGSCSDVNSWSSFHCWEDIPNFQWAGGLLYNSLCNSLAYKWYSWIDTRPPYEISHFDDLVLWYVDIK